MPKNAFAINQSVELSTSKSSGQFVQIPLELVRESEISPAALKLYLVLLSYAGSDAFAFPSQTRLAADMRLSERRVRSLLHELLETGLLEIRYRAGTSNLYVPLLRSGGKAEDNFRGGRKNSSAYLHEHDLKHVCSNTTSVEQLEQTDAKDTNASIESPSNILAVVPSETRTAEKEEEIVTILVEAGLTHAMGVELARVVEQNERNISYVKLIVETSRAKYIHNPIGFIRFMLLRNAEPVSKPSRTQPKQNKRMVSPQAPLDFSKYVDGKYAYLTGTTRLTQPSLPAMDEPEQPDTEVEIALLPETQVVNWHTIRRKLELSGEFTSKLLQYGKLKYCAETSCYRLIFPDWVDFTAKQKLTLERELTNLGQILLEISG